MISRIIVAVAAFLMSVSVFAEAGELISRFGSNESEAHNVQVSELPDFECCG